MPGARRDRARRPQRGSPRVAPRGRAARVHGRARRARDVARRRRRTARSPRAALRRRRGLRARHVLRPARVWRRGRHLQAVPGELSPRRAARVRLRRRHVLQRLPSARVGAVRRHAGRVRRERSHVPRACGLWRRRGVRRLGGSSPMSCGPDLVGTCWVLPPTCPPAALGDRWKECAPPPPPGPPPPPPPCRDTCSAIRDGRPHFRALDCGG